MRSPVGMAQNLDAVQITLAHQHQSHGPLQSCLTQGKCDTSVLQMWDTLTLRLHRESAEYELCNKPHTAELRIGAFRRDRLHSADRVDLQAKLTSDFSTGHHGRSGRSSRALRQKQTESTYECSYKHRAWYPCSFIHIESVL